MSDLDRDVAGERSYEPTELQKQRARRRGFVPRSEELTSGVTMLGAIVLLGLLGPYMLKGLIDMLRQCLGSSGPRLDDGSLWAPLAGVLAPAAAMVAGIVALAAAAGIAQVGLTTAGEAIAPQARRISPSAGLGRWFSLRTLERLALAIVKVAAVAAITWHCVGSWLARVCGSGRLAPEQLLPEFGGMLGSLALRLGLAVLAIGALDYVYQRYQHQRDLRMTLRQLREDLRQMEGDSRLKKLRRDLALKNAGAGSTINVGTAPAPRVEGVV